MANGPINKYFMQHHERVGVKAARDGFPAKGGTAPVTQFGFSDKTEGSRRATPARPTR